MSTEGPAAGTHGLLGRHMVVDSTICHGQLTFRGTRILVADVMDQVGRGLAWEAIIDEWDGRLAKAAIAEAVQLATQAFLSHTDKFVIELSPART